MERDQKEEERWLKEEVIQELLARDALIEEKRQHKEEIIQEKDMKIAYLKTLLAQHSIRKSKHSYL